MRPLLVALLVLVAGCRSTDVHAPPPIPPEATLLVLTDDEPARTLYASAWGAFAVAGWEVVEHDSDALRFAVRPGEGAGTLAVTVEEEAGGGAAPTARLVARPDPAADRAVLEAAADVLATAPGRITFR